MDGQANEHMRTTKLIKRVGTTKLHVSMRRKVSEYESSTFILNMRHNSKTLMVQVLYISGFVNSVANAHVAHIYVMAYLKNNVTTSS